MAELIGDDGEPVDLASMTGGPETTNLLAVPSFSSASGLATPPRESLLRNEPEMRIEPGELSAGEFEFDDEKPSVSFDSSQTVAIDQTMVMNGDEELSRTFDADRIDDEAEGFDEGSDGIIVEEEEYLDDEQDADYDPDLGPDDDLDYSGEDLEFGDEYEEFENEQVADITETRVPVDGPVPPRPLSSAVSRDFGAAPVTSRPRVKPKVSGLKTALGIIGGGLLAIPLAGGVLSLLGQTPDWGFYPFLGNQPKTVAGDSMTTSQNRPYGDPAMDDSSQNRLPEDTFSPGESASTPQVGEMQVDAMPAVEDVTALPMDSTVDTDFNPSPALSPIDADATLRESDDIVDSNPLRFDDQNANPLALEPMASSVEAPDQAEIQSLPSLPAMQDVAVVEVPPSEPAPPFTMPAEPMDLTPTDSLNPDAEIENVADSPRRMLDEMVTGQPLAIPAVPETPEPELPPLPAPDSVLEPELAPEPLVASVPPATPQLLDAISDAMEALRIVTEFPQSGDAADLKAKKAILYTTLSNVANVPQAISQPETTGMIDQVAKSRLMPEMTAVAMNWLRYSKRTHDGLFAVGEVSQADNGWILKCDGIKGVTEVQLQAFDAGEASPGDRVIVLAKIIDSSPPAIIRVVYMKKQ